MKPTLQRYLRLLDVLRARRGHPDWKPEDDRSILASLEDWYTLLGEEDRDVIESDGWRAWPESERLVDQNLDAADDGAVHEPPRARAA